MLYRLLLFLFSTFEIVPFFAIFLYFFWRNGEHAFVVVVTFGSDQYFHFCQTLFSGFKLKITNYNFKHNLHDGTSNCVFTLLSIQLRLYFSVPILSFLTRAIWPVFKSLIDASQRNVVISISNLVISYVLFYNSPLSPGILSLWFVNLLMRTNWFMKKEQLLYHSITVVKFDKYLNVVL